jgi:tetratricopeptide (TPR) repeat protein
MTKKFGRLPKKRVFIGVIGGLIILGAGLFATNYFYTQNQLKQSEQKKTTESERKKLDTAAFRGDRDIAAQYVERVQSNQQDAAYDLYESAAQKLTDTSAKIALYEQAVSIASRAKQTDAAIKYALSLSELSNTHRASANLAYLYGVNKDYANQKKYLQQALDQLEVLPKDSAEYTDMKTYYQDMLAKVGVN